MIVVDTSVLVDFLRGKATPAAEFLGRVEEDGTPFAIPSACCQELLQGARDAREWRLLLRYLESQIVLHPEDPWKTHVEAARIFFDCRRKGLTVRSSWDCWVAQLVLETKGVLLHDDQDFEHIRRIRPLRVVRP